MKAIITISNKQTGTYHEYKYELEKMGDDFYCKIIEDENYVLHIGVKNE